MVRFWTLGATDLRSDGHTIDTVLPQPRRLALLAYLALAQSRGFVRREVLLALFWPDSDEAHARNALRQALHFLRRALGDGVIIARGDDEIGIDPEQLWCDAVAFQQALAADNPAEALSIYRGDLLPGLHIADATSTFESWLDDERIRLRRLAAGAAWQASKESEAQGNLEDAIRYARRAVAESPGDEVAVRSLLTLLDRVGDHAGAGQTYREFERVLAAEYDLRPAPETRALLGEIRARVESAAGATVAIDAPSRPTMTAAPRVSTYTPPNAAIANPVSPPAARSLVTRQRAATVAAVVVAAGIAFGAWAGISRARATADASLSVLAVGDIRDDTQSDTVRDSRIVGDLLSTNLARLPEIRVLSRERMLEVLAQIGRKDPGRQNMATAARDAGATDLLEGALYHRPAGGYRLDIRFVDLRTGHVRRAFSADANDVFALVDSATRRFSAESAEPRRALRVADVTTTSLAAYRLYQEGIRAHAAGDEGAAERLFVSAVREDSTFAMAAYYAAVVTVAGNYAKSSVYFEQAARLASRASDRERLLILATQAHWLERPSRLPLATALVEKYPLEPDAQYRLGEALIAAGRFLAAVAPLRRVIVLDSLGLRGTEPLCRACDAYTRLAYAYFMADSLAAAQRTVREWTHAQPQSAAAWSELGRYLADDGKFREARAATRQGLALSASEYSGVEMARLSLLEEHYADADAVLRASVQSDGGFKRTVALWYLIISLRSQGRLDEALAGARLYRRISMGDERKLDAGGMIEAQTLLEQGHAAEAATLFATLARSVTDPYSEARAARHVAWRMTLEACALAAGGDTARLPRLADSVQHYANVSGFGRDQVLRHHVLGLLFAARGKDSAAASEFRLAIYSPNGGFTRTNLELSRVLLRLHRPTEAIAILRPALQVETDAMALYVTRTDVHEMLGRAFTAAGVPDSAAAHNAAVRSARALRAPSRG